MTSLKQLWDQAIADADATNREPEKKRSSAATANAPELTRARAGGARDNGIHDVVASIAQEEMVNARCPE